MIHSYEVMQTTSTEIKYRYSRPYKTLYCHFLAGATSDVYEKLFRSVLKQKAKKENVVLAFKCL